MMTCSFKPVFVLLCLGAFFAEAHDILSSIGLQDEILSPTVSPGEIMLKNDQAAQRLDQLKRAMEGGACSHLEILTAEREYLQVGLAKLRKSNPFSPLSTQESELSKKIVVIFEEEIHYLAAMSKQGLASEVGLLQRMLEATRFQRNIALMNGWKEAAAQKQNELCKILGQLIQSIEGQEQSGIYDAEALARAKGRLQEELARLKGISG